MPDAATDDHVSGKTKARRDLPGPTARWALLLDVDGTLLDIAPSPDAVVIPPDLIKTLVALRDTLDGAVALVSGRALSDLDRSFAPLRLPAAGQHGAELRITGEVATLASPDAPRLKLVRDRIEAFIAGRPGLAIEDKGHSMTVHYRGAPGEERALRQAAADAIAGVDELMLLEARMAFDIKPKATDKGRAVAALMAAAPFAARVPVFIGDDVTDEDGFAMARSLGGWAIRVGRLGPATKAQFRIASPRAARAWLAEVAAILAGLAR